MQVPRPCVEVAPAVKAAGPKIELKEEMKEEPKVEMKLEGGRGKEGQAMEVWGPEEPAKESSGKQEARMRLTRDQRLPPGR